MYRIGNCFAGLLSADIGYCFVCVCNYCSIWLAVCVGSVSMLTQGGPDQGSTNLVYIVYQYGFVFFQTGKAAALAILTMAVFAAFLLLKNRVLDKQVHYER